MVETHFIATLPLLYWQGVVVIGDVRDRLRYNQSGRTIAGNVTLDGVVMGRSVRIHHRASGMPCLTMTSGVDGNYQGAGFSGDDDYYVVALPSPADGANAVIADRVRGV